MITVTTPHKHVNVTRGGSVLLQCKFVTTAETTGLTIQWDFVSASSMDPQQVDTHCCSDPSFAPNEADLIKLTVFV